MSGSRRPPAWTEADTTLGRIAPELLVLLACDSGNVDETTRGHIMVDITVLDEGLDIEVRGIHKLWALKSTLHIPLSDVDDIRHDPGAMVARVRAAIAAQRPDAR